MASRIYFRQLSNCVCLQIITMEANRGHRQAKLRSAELLGEGKADRRPMTFCVILGSKAPPPALGSYAEGVGRHPQLRSQPSPHVLSFLTSTRSLKRRWVGPFLLFLWVQRGTCEKLWGRDDRKLTLFYKTCELFIVRGLRIVRQVRKIFLYIKCCKTGAHWCTQC